MNIHTAVAQTVRPDDMRDSRQIVLARFRLPAEAVADVFQIVREDMSVVARITRDGEVIVEPRTTSPGSVTAQG